MATKWVITTPSDRITIDEAQQGQVAFTVTNPTSRPDRVVFDVVPGDGADAAWFTVDEPQRRVAGNGSATYLVRAAVPATAPPGSYSVQGRAYSADSTPEEDSVLSSRLVLEVAAKAVPPPKKRPWWILVVAGLVVVVAVTVGLVVGLGGSHPAPAPSSAAAGGVVDVPAVLKQSGGDARTNLGVFGLKVGTVRYKSDPTADSVVYQSVAPGARVPRGTKVDLVVTTALTPPVPHSPATVQPALVSVPTTPVPSTPALAGASASAAPSSPAPAGSPSVSASASGPPAPAGVLTWTDANPAVHRWLVFVQQQVCSVWPYPGIIFQTQQQCYFLNISLVTVDRPAYTPVLPPAGVFNIGPFITRTTTVFTWHVASIDDFGGTGPASANLNITVQ